MDQKNKVGELISMNSERPGLIHLFEEEKVTIGKDQQNTNRIDDNRIANFHCSLFFQDGQVVLKNLCQQGTFLNKEKMGLNSEVNLEHGDHIHLLCQKGKTVTEKHVIAYMFFKYENKKQSVRKSSNSVQPVLEQISDNLICLICQEIYYEGVAVSPCGHVFCGYCLQQWENENNTCPICRVKMRKINKAFQINKIIDVLHEVNPQIEQKKKPDNKYFHQVENDQENESDSDSDSDRDIEIQELKLLLQNMTLQLRQERINHQANLNSMSDRLIQMGEIHYSRLEQYFNQMRDRLNISQDSEENERQNEIQNQQNGQEQNLEANQQRANIQSNSQPPQINQQRQ